MHFGINTWAWQLPVDTSNFDAFLDWATALDLPGESPVIECFASPDEADLASAALIREKASARGFSLVACGFNPNHLAPGQPSPHLASADPAERKAAMDRACGFIRYAAAVAEEGKPGILSGPWHVRHQHFTGSGPTPEERARFIDGLRDITRFAIEHNVLAGFEILNRFESYLINTVDQALDVIAEVGLPNLGINWDTSHAHIDEAETLADNLARTAQSGRLFHVHLSENHRRSYGTGLIGPQTPALLAALRGADYQLGVGLELFCEPLDPAIHKWSRTEGDPTAAARTSVGFLRQQLG
ncbi:MAG: sugar phosphate isomerase/epimerase family protein [Luteolibacter sp.]